MELILWRHAEAEEGVQDEVRKLTAKGEKQARQVAEWLNFHLPDDVRIVVSPATRTQQTARFLNREFETCKELGTDGSVLSALSAVGWPDAKGTVVLVGHQPTLGSIAAALMSGDEVSWSVKKGSVWWLSNRVRNGQRQTILRTVMSPEFLW